jgi:hypothetical protein
MLDFAYFSTKEKMPTSMRSVGAEGSIIQMKSLTKEEQSLLQTNVRIQFKVYNVP